MFLAPLLRWLGVEVNSTSHAEKLLSSLGALIALASVVFFSSHFLEMDAALVVVASMGASAVLLFAVPHGALSQPWPVAGGTWSPRPLVSHASNGCLSPP